MRENVALVMARPRSDLAREIESNQVKLTDIDNKIKAAIRTGHDDIATALIGEMADGAAWTRYRETELRAGKGRLGQGEGGSSTTTRVQVRRKTGEGDAADRRQPPEARMRERLARNHVIIPGRRRLPDLW
jgi:hypothetical protein